MSNSDNKEQSGPGPGDVQSRASRGVVKWFDQNKGIGFVVDGQTGEDVLLHQNILRELGLSSIAKEVELAYLVEDSARGARISEITEVIASEDLLTIADLTADELSALQPAIVKWFDAKKGYGFVIPYGEAKEVFFHAETLRLSSLGEVASGLGICVVIENDGPKAAVKYLFPWTDASQLEFE